MTEVSRRFSQFCPHLAIWLVALAALCGAGALALADQGVAGAACTSAPRASQTGVWQNALVTAPGVYVGGVYSQIYNYSPWVNPTTNDFTAAYVMMANRSSSSWAQVGWIEFPYGSRHTFLQVAVNGSPVVTRSSDSPYPTGSYIYYTALYNNTPGYFTFQVNNSAFPWAGYTVPAYFTPTEGDISGEIHDLASQLPGGYNYAEAFLDSHIFINGGWNYYVIPPYTYPINQYPADFLSAGPYGDLNWYIWDRRCP